jgi:hypothetical protein
MLTIENIDGILEAIASAEEDGQWDVVASLIQKAQVVLLADMSKRLEKIERTVSVFLI